ncbi:MULTISPECIES: NAD(P)/FAD-dependent oxidoreductase [Roseobacteraceae]|uniref:4-methylaminobutanoate oxidase (Formaldehyde-forming) n=1 Tax=Pseudosulfitobacter pseudonitzschiae TaxID=1402135 RepID=A0A221JZE4_9RHOB|nr:MULTISPECIES: FAD-dependent oxidoreductase [Roseobacteraceae]ASM72116.1 4-methylaminobutanoate oxidase (formaldehyde-forming) [Pseudosulfitobacter pseudonitzschiae]
MKVIVVGAGVIGASVAYRLALGGAQVTVLDGVGVAAGATGRSFGWINASFHADEAHFRLRSESMAAYHRLAEQMDLEPVRWTGCLCWEEKGSALEAQAANLETLGYDVQIIDRAEFAACEPHVANPPERALAFDAEGVAETALLAQALINAATALGAQVMLGVNVLGIATQGDAVSGVHVEQGVIPADRVVVCGGTGSTRLLDTVGVALPMLSRPGLLLRSAPVAPVLSHVMAAPGQEFRQDATGHIIAPTSANHQSDNVERITERPDLLADAAMARLQALLPEVALRWEQVTQAMRPVPQDGLPVMGPCGPAGLHMAVMHSGITLAPLAGELVAAGVLDQPLTNHQNDLVGPYRPQRFQL